MKRKSFFAGLKEMLFLKWRRGGEELQDEPGEEKWDNPYLPCIREIIEAVLVEKNISYRDFFPVFVDGQEKEKTLFSAKKLDPELNRMAILTDDGTYYDSYRDTMYEEQGLIIEIFPKEEGVLDTLLGRREGEIVILDFELEKELITRESFGETVYIPVFKKRWESVGNIDIEVPIGYNTLIVRGIHLAEKQPVLDKFERAFYDKE